MLEGWLQTTEINVTRGKKSKTSPVGGVGKRLRKRMTPNLNHPSRTIEGGNQRIRRGKPLQQRTRRLASRNETPNGREDMAASREGPSKPLGINEGN